VNGNLLTDIDEMTGDGGVGDTRDGKEKATFGADYTLDPNIQIKPLVADNGEDPIRDANGNYVFAKGENGKYKMIITDAEGKEHVVETESFPFTIKDANGNTYEVIEDADGSVRTENRGTVNNADTENNNKDGDIKIYFILKRLNDNETPSDAMAENIFRQTNEKDYYSSSSYNTVSTDEGRYICIPVRKNIKYTVYNGKTDKTELAVKKSSEFVPFGMKSGEATYKRLSWSENPVNRYDITHSVNGKTQNTEGDKRYTVLDLKRGVSDSIYVIPHQVNDYVSYAAGNSNSPAEVPYGNKDLTNDILLYGGADLAYTSGIFKASAGKIQEAGTVEFEINEFNHDGTFGFDGYNDKVKVFEDRYEKLPGKEYKVSNMSMWLNESKTIRAKVKKNPQSTGGSAYYKFKPEGNGLTVSGDLLNENGELVIENKDLEFEITIKVSNKGKNVLSVLDKDGKTVGKLNVYGKDKNYITQKQIFDYKVVDVTFGDTPPGTTPVKVNLSNYSEGSDIEKHLNQKSFNQAFTQFKNTNTVLEDLTIPQSELNRKKITADISLLLDSAFRNRSAILDLLKSKYKSSVTAGERIIFLINNRDMLKTDGMAEKSGTSIVIFQSALTNWEVFVHELGHTFELEHPFETSGYSKGSTPNFMDYSVKTNMFWYWQWKIINTTDFK
jgi:hypothetical protein